MASVLHMPFLRGSEVLGCLRVTAGSRGGREAGGEVPGRYTRVRSPNGQPSHIAADLGCTELLPEGLPSSSR